MFVLGMLAVLQITLLPGLLLIRLFDGRRGFIQNLAYVFALSVLSNYVGVLILVALNLYLRPVVFALFAIELVLLYRAYREALSTPVVDWVVAALNKAAGIWQILVREVQDLREKARSLRGAKEGDARTADLREAAFAFLRVFFGLIALGTILWMAFVVIDQIGTVYQQWDSWAIWDPWTVDWSRNEPASNTWTYPQLVPVNNSLTYLFIGSTEVKFFAKGIMPLFTFLTLLLIFDLGLKDKSFGYFLGVGVAFFGINRFMGKYLAEGYVDLPVAMFSLLAIYTLLKAREVEDRRSLKQLLVLGSLTTAVAAVTKQQGFYVLVLYPFLAYFILLKDYAKMSGREKFNILLWPFVSSLVIAVPWYVYTGIQISAGRYPLNIGYVINDIYEGLTLPERFVAAMASLDRFALIFPFLLLALPFLDRAFRLIMLTVILPYTVLWAFFLSYEHRNLSVAFPLAGLAAGVAVEGIVRRIRFERFRSYALPAVILVSLLALSAVFTSGRLYERQITLQKDIFHHILNRNLYNYFEEQGKLEAILTDYPVDWLPGLEGTWRVQRFRDYAVYQQALLDAPDVELLLLPLDSAEPRIVKEVRAKIESGEFKLIFEQSNYLFARMPVRE